MDINKERLLDSIFMLGKIGIDASGERTRLAASDAEKEGRDFVVKQMREAGLDVVVDRIGNIFGIWQTEENRKEAPLMIGSHIDTVINAGQYDGCYGVLTGIEIVRTLKEQKAALKRPLVVGAFTNEEGVRYQPDMMGSLVYAGDLSLDEALDSVGTDGTILRDELTRIGYVAFSNLSIFFSKANLLKVSSKGCSGFILYFSLIFSFVLLENLEISTPVGIISIGSSIPYRSNVSLTLKLGATIPDMW